MAGGSCQRLQMSRPAGTSCFLKIQTSFTCRMRVQRYICLEKAPLYEFSDRLARRIEDDRIGLFSTKRVQHTPFGKRCRKMLISWLLTHRLKDFWMLRAIGKKAAARRWRLRCRGSNLCSTSVGIAMREGEQSSSTTTATMSGPHRR